MTLASSGTMSLAGTATDRSIQVELGGNGTTQASMNDAAVRALGDQTEAGSAINMSTDFYGKTAGGSAPPAQYLPVSLSGTDSATDSSIPAQIQPVNGTQISGTTYWRRVRLTSSQAGNFRLYCNPVRSSTAVVMYRSDMQANMLIVTQSGTETEVPLLVGSTGAANWQRHNTTSTSTQPTSWSAVTTSNTSQGRFLQRITRYPTGSSGTGRLENFISPSTGYGYFETTSMSTSVPLYLWVRSPQYTLAVGDTIDFYYGVDCAGLSSINFYLAA